MIKRPKLKYEIERSGHGRSIIHFPKNARGQIFDSLGDVAKSKHQEAKKAFEIAKAFGGTVAELEFQLVVLYPNEFESYDAVQEIYTYELSDDEGKEDCNKL